MANIKGQVKRNITNEKRRLANSSFRSELKTAVKLLEASVQNKDKANAELALSTVNKKLDKSISKGINHKNYVARQKSRLAKLVNSI